MTNKRARQTYFGAVDPRTREVTVIEADAGDTTWTLIFLEYLRECYAEKQLLICWDGASYHRSNDIRTYLEGLNQHRPKAAWTITCLQFAPHAPAQNPIETIWLKAKSTLRRNWHRMDGTFQAVKDLFAEAIMTMPVDFPKLHMYTSHV